MYRSLNIKSLASSLTILALSVSLLTACKHDDDDDDDDNTVESASQQDTQLKGVFINSPVQGLKYSTETLSGLTDSQGQFEYKNGEIVTFMLGGIELGKADGASTITPSDLSHAGIASNSPKFNNMLRLLQTLDDDCNATNGIVINEAMQTFAADINFDLTRTELEFENNESLLNLLSKSTCAQSWISQLQAETHYRLSLQAVETERLKKIAFITPEGETEPKIAVDDEGNAIYLLPGKAEYNESSVIMLQSSSGDTLHISVDDNGLPKEAYLPDGTIIIFSNQTGESVDIMISPLGSEGNEITARVKLNDLARLYFSLIDKPSATSLLNHNIDSNRYPDSFSIFDLFVRKAIAADDATQILSDGMKNAGSIISYIKEVGNVVSVTFSGHSKLAYLKEITTSILESVLWKAALNGLEVDKDQQRVADLSLDALGCAGTLNVAGCGKLAFDSAAVTIELGGVAYDIFKDRHRIAALKEALKAIDFESFPPVIALDSSNNGKTFSVKSSITFNGTAIDPNEGTIPPERLTWSSSLDGELGTGETVTTSDLSPGMHIITLTAVASDGEERSRWLSIEISNEPPVVTVSIDSKGTTYAVGETIVFAGTAIDPEGEELLSENLEWHTSVGNVLLGVGGQLFVDDLAAPVSNDPDATVVHTITFSARDSYDEIGSASINVTITNSPPPTITITTTETNYPVGSNALITANAENYLGEVLDGNTIVWSIEGSGTVGSGNTFSIKQLSEGSYTLTATVTDTGIKSTAMFNLTVGGGVLQGRLPATPGGKDYQAYYDPVANLTWLADANYAQTSGHDADGLMTWQAANDWAAQLTIGGVSGWRLADTLESDESCSMQRDGFSDGFDCTGSEMGNLFYNTLGRPNDYYADAYEPIRNVQTGEDHRYYWSATPQSGIGVTSGWAFDMLGGYQSTTFKGKEYSGWAVRSGDVRTP